MTTMSAPDTIPRPVGELFPRVRQLVHERRTELAPSTMRVSAESYRDQAALDTELELVLGASPLVVAPSSSVAGPNDFLARSLLGRQIVATRDEQGGTHVLVNVCRHRGALVAQGQGCGRRLTCPY